MVSVLEQFQLADFVFPYRLCFPAFFEWLIIFDWRQDNVKFSLLDDGYYFIPINILFLSFIVRHN